MNHVCLTGRMTKDPELRSNRMGLPVVNFMLAVPRNKEQAEFIPIVAWRRLAQDVANYGFKGISMSISGYLRENEFLKDGVLTHSITVEAFSIDFHSKRPDPEKAPTPEDAAADVPFTVSP